MKLLIILFLSFTAFTASASRWESRGTIDMTQFKTAIEFVEFIQLFDMDVVSHGEDPETGDQGGCLYETNIDSLRAGGNLSYITLGFSHSGTPAYCDDSFIEELWLELSQMSGVELAPLNEL